MMKHHFNNKVSTVLKKSILLLLLFVFSISLQSQTEDKFHFEFGGGIKDELFSNHLATSSFLLIGHFVHLKSFEIGMQYSRGLKAFGSDYPFRSSFSQNTIKQELQHTSNLMLTFRYNFNFYHTRPFIGVGIGPQYRREITATTNINFATSYGGIPILVPYHITPNVFHAYRFELGYNHKHVGGRIMFDFIGKAIGQESHQNYTRKPGTIISLATVCNIGQNSFKAKKKNDNKVQATEQYKLLMHLEAGLLYAIPMDEYYKAARNHLYLEYGIYFLERFGLSAVFQFPGRFSGLDNYESVYYNPFPYNFNFDNNEPEDIQALQLALNLAIVNKEKLRVEASFMAGKFQTNDINNFGWTMRLGVKSGIFKNAIFFCDPGSGLPIHLGWQSGMSINFRKRVKQPDAVL